jgi:hypothetical protein
VLPTASSLLVCLPLLPGHLTLGLSRQLLLRMGWAAANGLTGSLGLSKSLAGLHNKPQLTLRRTVFDLLLANRHDCSKTSLVWWGNFNHMPFQISIFSVRPSLQYF